MLKPGDKVVVRAWDDMEKEFGLNSFGSIDVLCHFVEAMRKFCGQIVTISFRHAYSGTFIYRISEDYGHFEWSSGMFEPEKGMVKYYLRRRNANGYSVGG